MSKIPDGVAGPCSTISKKSPSIAKRESQELCRPRF